MGFRGTPQAVVELLLIALAVWSIAELGKRRFASNLPVLFYVAVFVFVRQTGIEFNLNLFIAGVLIACLLRFEFMNGPITKVILFLEVAAICGISVLLAGDAFDLHFYR